MDTPNQTPATTPKRASRDSIHAGMNLHHLHPRTPAERTAWIEANRALVPHALAPLMRRYPDLSDADKGNVMAAGLRALVLAVDKFDPNAGVKLSTYAYKLIEFAGRKALSMRGNWKAARAGVFVGSLDAPIEAGNNGDGTTARIDLVADAGAAESFVQVLDDAGAQGATTALWEWIRDTVTPRQFKALRAAFVDGKTQVETADGLGKSRQCISNHLQKGLARLQKAANTKDGRKVAVQIFGTE